MSETEALLLGYLREHCRGPVGGRKVWKLCEDLRTLGLDVGAAEVLAAAEELQGAGVGVIVTGGELPVIYLDGRRRALRQADDQAHWRSQDRRRRRGRPRAASCGEGGAPCRR